MGNNAFLNIVFFHQGFSPYLPFALHQARVSNPDARIVLLGDEGNRMRGLDYEHRPVPPTSARRSEFAKIYRHFHPGNLEDERRCIERWLALADFLERETLSEFLFLDSDMLLFQDLRCCLPAWKTWDAAGAPLFYSFCFFFRPGLVNQFADWILDQYRNKKVMRIWEREFQRHRQGRSRATGIIQDMELARLFIRDKRIRVLDVSRISQDGWMVDTGRWGGAYLQGRAETDVLVQKKLGGEVMASAKKRHQTRFRALHVQGYDKSHIAGLTGWSLPALNGFFRPKWSRNLRLLLKYLWNGARFRRYLSR
jgi:hypothetical protein